ncbi:MAG: alpha/beta hydrolase [Oscillatoria sp. PMC 1068.18]|nr:alpha/beta hydrolase [Oscillatoria sp. PMC 1076.18]MEC4991856.1 alpha/beta hydrolase [Oscillatoria sp. PMC 1068.18]
MYYHKNYKSSRKKRQIVKSVKRSLIYFSSILTAAGVFFVASSAEAADSVVLKYKFLRESVSIPELTALAETGEVSSSLNAYLKMANKEPEELRRVLNDEIDVNGLLLSRLLNTTPGELVLDQVSEIIHTPTNRANQQALRAALVKSALEDNQISLIEMLQNYPTTEVHVEGERIEEVYNRVSGLLKRIPRLPF